jgi:hypothetical protein
VAGPEVDGVYAAILRAGENTPAARALLAEIGSEAPVLLAVLRRAVPLAFLEAVATSADWSVEPRVMAAVVQNTRATRDLGLRLVGGLFWRDLADVAANPRVPMAVRVRAEALLVEQLPDRRLGEKITLAKIATPPVLRVLMEDPEPKVASASLVNARLTEDELVAAVRRDTAPRALLEAAPASARWSDSYALRVALVLQPRTPVGVALGQLTRLLDKDLRLVASTAGLLGVVQAAALRVARER